MKSCMFKMGSKAGEKLHVQNGKKSWDEVKLG
jgi:hypothetical protein